MLWFADDSEGSKTSKLALIAIAGVGLVAAVYVGFGRRNSVSGQLNTPESATPYVCQNDGETFTLTPAQFEQKLNAGEVVTQSADGSRGGVLKVKCPKCGQVAAVMAARCPKDKTIVPMVDKTGKPGRCPKCGGDPFNQPQGG